MNYITAQKMLLNLGPIESETIDAALIIRNERIGVGEIASSRPEIESNGACSATVSTLWYTFLY